jgi:hypothetical protein
MTEKEAREICEKAAKQNGYALEFVPCELRTQELCEKAVEQDGCALQFVPDELRDEVKAAVKMRREK